MAKPDTDSFLQLLEKSGLVEASQLAPALAKVKAACGGELPEDTDALAEKLIEIGTITRWQSASLLNGKYKGFRLGRFKLLGHLGSGGMSSVYLAEHIVMRHKVAIKVLPRSKVEDSSYLARFKREAEAAAKIQHRNIARAHDFDNEGKTYYIVMDYVEGVNLQTLVKENGPLDYETAADYMAQAAEGLHVAHEAGLVHRDIKPANLLVDTSNTVKILDMGLAMINDGDDDKPSLTVVHDENVLGTADYLAPEQAINSHLVDRRADIYSLGCTLYYLLTGHPPFPEGTLPQRLMKHQTQVPPSIYEDRADAPQALVNICLRMMVKDPNGRYQTAQEVSQELSHYLINPQQPGRGVRVMPTGGYGGGGGFLGSGDTDAPGGKVLKERGAGSPKRRTPPPGAGDTLSNKDSATFKGPARPPVRKPTEPGSNPNLTFTVDDSDKGKRSASEARLRKSPPPGARKAENDSGEFVFDTGAFGNPSSSSSNKTLMQRRHERKSNSDMPWWIWATIAGGILVVGGLIYLIAR